jgi:hypothetical protein
MAYCDCAGTHKPDCPNNVPGGMPPLNDDDDYLALLIVIAVLVVIGLLSRWPVWRRCRCGAHYCTGCGRKQ